MTSEGSCREIAINIAAVLKTLAPPLTPYCCIYTVANNFHKLNDEAYTPRVISIGPFHSEKPEIQFMERQKGRYMLQFIHRSKLSLESLVTFVRDSEENIRLCYAEIIELQNEDFVKMILLDGSFIIEYFLEEYFGTKDENNIILFNPHLRSNILIDLILLENQLPFWFLEELYNLSSSIYQDNTNIPFVKIACHYFSYLNKRNILPQNNILHFTDLIRSLNLSFDPRKAPTQNFSRSKYFSCSATDLRAAVVKFKANDSKCLFDIQFTVNDGVLSFPHFEIHGKTETIFRNLMALEQYHYRDQTHICDYIILMKSLINTSKDVEILVKKEIMTNRFDSDDVLATLINNLGRDIIFSASNSYFCKLGDDLMEYYDKPRLLSSSSLIYCVSDWYKWKSNLKEDYFSTPWKIVSIIAATILLVLTFIQTVNSF